MKNNWQAVTLIFCVAIYIIYFTTASFLRYDNFYTGRFDLGNMDQTVWNTINGRIFQTSDFSGKPVSRLTTHADFLLIFLSPFYLIWSHPKMLLLIQAIVLGVGAFFVYAIAKDILKNKSLSLLFAVTYLLYPALQYTNLYDFHAVTLATTFLLAAFYFLLKNKYILLIIFLVLSGFAKEQVWLVCALFGIYIFLFKKKSYFKKLGIFVFIASSFLLYYLIWHAIPSTRGEEHFAISYYSQLGDSPTEVVRNFLLSPQSTIGTILSEDRLNYLGQLFRPLGFLSLLSPFYLIFALPDLFINLLSNNSNLHQIYYQYSAIITPFIFISSIYGIGNFMRWFRKVPHITYYVYISLFLLYSCYITGPLPGTKRPNTAMFTKPQENRQIIDSFLSGVPKEYSISATNNLGSHLSQRQLIATIPDGIGNADMVLFLVNDISSKQGQDQMILVNKLRNDENYREVFKKEGFVVFKKKDLI